MRKLCRLGLHKWKIVSKEKVSGCDYLWCYVETSGCEFCPKESRSQFADPDCSVHMDFLSNLTTRDM